MCHNIAISQKFRLKSTFGAISKDKKQYLIHDTLIYFKCNRLKVLIIISDNCVATPLLIPNICMGKVWMFSAVAYAVSEPI